ncbi:hypothetical protein C2S53_019384 [Perilla frutescens var. hirtella]|uniref:Uncharacterized protein n=1 Tax=Perilla frutescens var. hirtella TaxID=608512 RepID=A0AAD4PDX6_PERFH|nr:hypothetical protein C2S53_019384 [Perilla frutescens var. hirtella]
MKNWQSLLSITTGNGSDKEWQYEAEPVPNTYAAEGTAFCDATSTDYTCGGSPFHDARNDDAAADDNGGFSNCTFHDFTAWIHREGGINELLSMLVPTNQPTSSRNQVEPEAEDVNNWIIPVIHLDCTDSPVRKAEFKVPRSCGSHLEYTCKRNPSCTFELRASWRGSYWIVHKFNMQHTCNLDLDSVDARNNQNWAHRLHERRTHHPNLIILTSNNNDGLTSKDFTDIAENSDRQLLRVASDVIIFPAALELQLEVHLHRHRWDEAQDGVAAAVLEEHRVEERRSVVPDEEAAELFHGAATGGWNVD